MKRETFDAIVRSPFFRDFAEAFNQATGAPLRFIPAGESARRAEVGSPDNPFCRLLSRLPGARALCEQRRAAALARAAHTRVPCQVQCFFGLTAIAVPVVVADRHIGSFLSGQVWSRQPTHRSFDRAMRKLLPFVPNGDIGTLRAKLKKEYFSTRVVTPRQFRGILKLAEMLAFHLTEFAHRRVLASHCDDLPAIERAKQFIESHATDSVTLSEAAQHAHLSPGHFCRLFRQTTGLTLIDYLNRFRVEKAKDLLLAPAATVKEVALSVGFCCVTTFERAFRKYTGIPPTEFRRAQRERTEYTEHTEISSVAGFRVFRGSPSVPAVALPAGFAYFACFAVSLRSARRSRRLRACQGRSGAAKFVPCQQSRQRRT